MAQWLDGLWRSLVAHLLWEQGAVGSNPASPTITLLAAQVRVSLTGRAPAFQAGGEGSTPFTRSSGPVLACAPVAQRTEQEPSKLLVGGSNPSGGTGTSW